QLSNPPDRRKRGALIDRRHGQPQKLRRSVCSSRSTARRPLRGRPSPTQRSAEIGSREGERFEIQSAAFTATQDNRVLVVEAIQLIDARPTFDRLVRQTFLAAVFDWSFDALHLFDLV